MQKNILRSTAAVLAGFISVLVLSILTDILLEQSGIFPPQSEPVSYGWWMLLLALVYRSLYGALGGYLAAQLAPHRPMRHTIILGTIGFVFAALGTLANWNKTSPSTQWYPILLVLFTFPCVWLGGKAQTARSNSKVAVESHYSKTLP